MASGWGAHHSPDHLADHVSGAIATALAGLAVAIVTDNAVIARVGSAVGLVGAIAFAWFTADVIWRMLPGKQS